MNARKLFLLGFSILVSFLSASTANDQENINPSASVKFFTPNDRFDPCLPNDNEALCRATEQAINYFRNGLGKLHGLSNTNIADFFWFTQQSKTQLPVKK
jgi:hypothetical protein